MIDPQHFFSYLKSQGIDFFVGVPDSLLKELNSCLTDNLSVKQNIIAANEGNAIGIAAGYHLATGKIGAVYMQNSGIGNAVNPLLSLTDEAVYKIPLLLIIGWRGEPGIKDEPQHIKQGELTIPLLDTMGIKNIVLNEDYRNQVVEAVNFMKKNNKSVALIVKKGLLDVYDCELKSQKYKYDLTREESLTEIVGNLSENDFIISTTGKTSRELYEIREKLKHNHANDFLTVGSMGHASSIALGLSLHTTKTIYCIDGDGAFLMHMGAVAVNASLADKNFKYIIINNGAHESVGSQPTVGFKIDMKSTLMSLGFEKVYVASTLEEVKTGFNNLKKDDLNALIINVKPGSRKDLGRPTSTPEENKLEFMKKISKE